LQQTGPDLGGNTAGDIAHRGEQRQAAGAAGHGLVGDAGGAALDQVAGLVRIGRQVQVGEQHLALAQHLALDRLRLLHLDDHVGVVEHVLGRLDDLGAGGDVGIVIHADAGPRAGLDDHLMAVRDDLAHRGRRHADAEFLDLDLLGHTDEHGAVLPERADVAVAINDAGHLALPLRHEIRYFRCIDQLLE